MRTHMTWVAALAVLALANPLYVGASTAQRIEWDGAVTAKSGTLLGNAGVLRVAGAPATESAKVAAEDGGFDRHPMQYVRVFLERTP